MTVGFETGIPLWLFPHQLFIVTGLTKDVYGKVTATATTETRGLVSERPIELSEGGTRATRAGATIKVARRTGISVVVGTIIKYGTDTYTVVGFGNRPDYWGNVNYWNCDCVKKAQDRSA